MIVQIAGKLIEKKEQSVILDVNGLCYEILAPTSVLQRMDETVDDLGRVRLVIYHYLQITPASGLPILVGFINEIERDFFLQFIKVSGIGPRAAVKALNKPISEITQAIDRGDIKFLKTLPGIGLQRAKEVVAKLQGKVGRFALIQDQNINVTPVVIDENWQNEALTVLLQLQYKKHEAADMIKRALEHANGITTTEDLLNEIYKQKVRI